MKQSGTVQQRDETVIDTIRKMKLQLFAYNCRMPDDHEHTMMLGTMTTRMESDK